MKNRFKLFGIIAMVAVIGFSMTGCPTDSSDNDNGNPAALHGTWLGQEEWATFVLNSDGTGYWETPFSWSSTATTATITIIGEGYVLAVTVDWVISGNTLVFSNPRGNAVLVSEMGHLINAGPFTRV